MCFKKMNKLDLKQGLKDIFNKLILTKEDREELADLLSNTVQEETIGDLQHLETIDKSSIVNAINEALGAGPKIFHLLTRPTTDMTTLEELAATGITPQVVNDMYNGKYYAINIPSRGVVPIQHVDIDNELFVLIFGYYYDLGDIESGILFRIKVDENGVVVRLKEI